MIIQVTWHQPLLMKHLAWMFEDESLDINRCWCITWQLFDDEDFYCYSISRAIITSRNVCLKIHLNYMSDWTKQLVLLMTSSHLKNKSKANVRWMLHWDGWRQGKAKTTQSPTRRSEIRDEAKTLAVFTDTSVGRISCIKQRENLCFSGTISFFGFDGI